MVRFFAAPIVVLALLSAVPPATAAPVDDRWDEVGEGGDGVCTLAVTGNGRFFRIAADGLEPGAAARYTVGNGDMKPLDWIIWADAAGQFARYYLPFRWSRRGDVVTVSVRSERCAVATEFAWRRAEVVVR